ncbi:C-type mannose receptor 2-like [Lytechinus pictus]|uniref:C-type mannose receptor 2-like n=1 Tax=Lytechinus pictus TaxID=7653 RepID=UPI0030BA12EE
MWKRSRLTTFGMTLNFMLTVYMKSRQYYFFGANDIQKHGTWTYGNGTDDSSLPYLNWADGQPDDVGGSGEDCVSMQYAYNWLWNDEVCEKKFQVVCENENNDGDGHLGRYTAHYDSMTYAEAQAHCVKYEGSMATIQNDKDQKDMVELLNSIYDPFKSDIFWLGVNDINREDHWVTGGDPDSSTTQTFFKWRQGEPNNYQTPGEHCGLMAPVDESDPDNYKFEWYDWSCGNAERFICEDIDPNSNYWGSGGHRYSVVNEAMTWSEASSYCKSKGGRLAQVRTSSDQLYSINRMLSANREKLLSSKGAWIGLNDLSHQMTFEWADGSDVTYTNWNVGEPDDFTDSQDCVFAYSQSGKDSTGREYYAGKWADYDCKSEDFGYVCQKEKGHFNPSEIPPPEYDCPMGWTGSDVYCYKLLEGQLTWDEAHETCRQDTDHGKPTNSTLAYIPDYEEQSVLAEALQETSGLYWIGLHGTVTKGTMYEWVTGQPVTYTAWDESQPGSDQHPCVAMSAGAGETRAGQWDDQDCGSRYSAICQKPRSNGLHPDIPVTPSPTGSCPGGWETFGSYCYLVVRETNETMRRDLSDASYDCYYRTSGQGTRLGSFHSWEEEEFVAGLVKDLEPSVDPEEGFWLGMSLSPTYSYFWWYDGSPVQYVHWGPNMPEDRPQNTYVGLVAYPASNGKGWEFIDSDSKRNSICKAPTDTYVMTTLPDVSPGLSPKCGDDWHNWTYNANLDTCYRFMGLTEQNRAIWKDAGMGCQGQKATLVSIHSREENKFVEELVNRHFFDAAWTGLNSHTTSGGGFRWADGSPADYFQWDEHEPGDEVKMCVKLNAETGGWSLEECDTQMAYVCKRDPGGHAYTPAPTQQGEGFCPKNWFTWGNKCFQFVDYWETWTNHRNICQSLGGDLASIRDRSEQAYIVTLLENEPYPVWIGLNDQESEGLFTWSDGTPVLYTNWDRNEPNDNGHSEDCIVMFGSNSGNDPGVWNDAECTQKYKSLCQIPRDADGTPPSPTLSLCGSYHHYGNACYKIHNGTYTREQAKKKCESDGLGSTLASINSIYENNEISLMLNNAGIDSPMYIGLIRKNNTYGWDDTWPVVYTRWASGQPSLGPDEKCVAIQPNKGAWDDVPCDQKYGAVCKFTQGGIPPQQPTLSPEDCPDSDWSVHGSACYKAYLQDEFVVPWSAARYVCNGDRASLVSIHSTRERDFVISLVKGDIYSVWIGLNNIDSFGFTWEDETPYEYTSWAPGEPSGTNGDEQDEECTQMYTNGGHVGQWNDLYCLEKWPFVCKYTTGGPIYMTTAPSEQKPIGGALGVGAIVGIAIAGVAFIVIVAGLVAMLRRQKRMVAYFRSVAGLEVAPEQLFNEDNRGGRTGSFDDAMLSVNT